MAKRPVRTIYLHQLFTCEHATEVARPLLRRAPKRAGVEFYYQLLDGSRANRELFEKLTGMDKMKVDYRFHHRLVLFCQLWMQGHYDLALEMIDKEIEAKFQRALSYAQKNLGKDKIERSSYVNMCGVPVAIFGEMAELKKARTKWRAKASRVKRRQRQRA